MLKALIRLPFALIRRVFALRPVRLFFRMLMWLFVICAAISLTWVILYRFINPPITSLMIMERFRTDKLEYEWRPLEKISPNLAHAVIASEDSQFCSHSGFNFEEIYKALQETDRRRGGSTITQQTAKNAFLWPDASWLRKGVEAGFTVLTELFWPKSRIVEVYLNIAEFDTGVFGAEAAAQQYFGVSADALTIDQAARLAWVLPSPRRRTARDVNLKTVRQIRNDIAYIRQKEDYDCLPDPSGK